MLCADQPMQDGTPVASADERAQGGCTTPWSSPAQPREQSQPGQVETTAPIALARLPPAGNGLQRWKNLSV